MSSLIFLLSSLNCCIIVAIIILISIGSFLSSLSLYIIILYIYILLLCYCFCCCDYALLGLSFVVYSIIVFFCIIVFHCHTYDRCHHFFDILCILNIIIIIVYLVSLLSLLLLSFLATVSSSYLLLFPSPPFRHTYSHMHTCMHIFAATPQKDRINTNFSRFPPKLFQSDCSTYFTRT